ncbi:hypothetical protein CCP2SC5_310031 [Azospirillaceae bacterium]
MLMCKAVEFSVAGAKEDFSLNGGEISLAPTIGNSVSER